MKYKAASNEYINTKLCSEDAARVNLINKQIKLHKLLRVEQQIIKTRSAIQNLECCPIDDSRIYNVCG